MAWNQVLWTRGLVAAGTIPLLTRPPPIGWIRCKRFYSKKPDQKQILNELESLATQDPSALNAKIQSLAKSKHISEAFAALQFAQPLAVLDTKTCNVMIGALLGAKERSQALYVLEKMKAMGIKKNQATNKMSISVLSHFPDRLDEAKKVFDQMKLRDREGWMYGTMMKLCFINDDAEQAFKYFDQMKEGGVPMSLRGYETVLNICAKSGHYENAWNYFRESLDSMELVSPQSATSTVKAIAVAAELGDVTEDMRETLEEFSGQLPLLREAGKVDSFLVSMLINAFGRLSLLDRAEQIFTTTELKRTAYMYVNMIAAYGRHGEGRKAMQMFEEMTSNGFKPDVVAFNALLDALYKSDMKGNMLDVLQQMRKDGVAYDVATSSIMMSAFSGSEEITNSLMKELGMDTVEERYSNLTKQVASSKTFEGEKFELLDPVVLDFHLLSISVSKSLLMQRLAEIYENFKNGMVLSVQPFTTLTQS